MRTLNTVLPVYDRISKQCYERSKRSSGDKPLMAPVVTPQYRLPSMLWKVEGDSPGYITSILMIDKDGNETEIREYFINEFKLNTTWGNWASATYDTFTPVDYSTFLAVKTTAADVDFAYSDDFAVTENETIVVRIELTLTSGTAPVVAIVDSGGTDISDAIRTEDGMHYYNLTVTTTDANARIRLRNLATEVSNYAVVVLVGKSSVPYIYDDGTNEYFYYNGDTIGEWDDTLTSWQDFLPAGEYYLKITTSNDYIYYTDWFLVDCVYSNLIEGFSNFDYDTFGSVGTRIDVATNIAGAAAAYSSNTFSIVNGDEYTVIFYGNLTSGQLPYFGFVEGVTQISNVEQIETGLNIITLTATASSDSARLIIYNLAASVFFTSEILIIKSYSENYLKFYFYHSCDLDEIIYSDGFRQTLWLKSETMEPTYPYTEKGQENGYGQFIPTWQRQEKNYIIRTLLVPQFIIDVLHRLKLHDNITLTDLVGDEYTVKSIDVEHEWQFDDKYYALATLTVDLDETLVTTACCTEINECP